VSVLGLLLAGCPKNANPDVPSPPRGIDLSRVGSKVSLRVTATDPDFDRVSVRMDWDDGDTSDWSEPRLSGDTVTVEHVWAVPGNFWVSAQAKDEKGLVSLWSNWHQILIEDTVSLPPGRPQAPSGPDSGTVDSAYEFSARAGDPNHDRMRLQFDWGEGDTSEWGFLAPESTVVKMSHAWDSAGEYSVRVRARDEKELVGEWSDVHLITVWPDSTQ
jgi:hypothetical protein